jgi:hypothetical protein
MARMIRWLLAWARCDHHETLYKERVKGQLTLICDRCGRSFPVALSDKKLGKRLAARMRESKLEQAQVIVLKRKAR